MNSRLRPFVGNAKYACPVWMSHGNLLMTLKEIDETPSRRLTNLLRPSFGRPADVHYLFIYLFIYLFVLYLPSITVPSRTYSASYPR